MTASIKGCRSAVRRFGLLATLVATAALSVIGGGPVMAVSGDGLAQVGSTTRSSFHLRPQLGRVDAVVDFAITNRIPARGRLLTYIDEWRLIVLDGARDVQARGPGVRVRPIDRFEAGTVYAIEFPRIFNGQTRRFRVSYHLPAAGPRSANLTRITDAYSHFCWHGQPSDSGSVLAVMSSNFEPTTYVGNVSTRRSGEEVTVRAKARPGALGRFVACTDSFKPDRLVQSLTTTADGQVVTVQGWREDPEWTAAVTGTVERSLDQLEAFAGMNLPADVIIRQVASQSMGEYGGQFDSREKIVRVSEKVDDPILLAHELGHAWFNDRTMSEPWMFEAHASWLGYAANVALCPDKGSYPGKGKPDLSDWQFLGLEPTTRERRVVEYQYAAACSLAQEVMLAAGVDAVTRLNASLLDRTPKYGGTPDARAPKPDWREWLDAVDEVALVPAGIADLRTAEEMLLDEGIASRRDLRGRADARARYHAAMAGSEVDFMPIAVRDAMDAWKFDRAMDVLAMAEEAMTLAAQADEASGVGSIQADRGGSIQSTAALLVQATSEAQVRQIRDDLKGQ